MLPSKRFLSLPVISLKEGQQVGYVRNLVINPKIRNVAALIVDPKGFFKEQRIIPFNRIVSLGENAIVVSSKTQVEKAANLPDILDLLKEKAAIIGIKAITENGKSLGIIDEFYIDPQSGHIAGLDISEGKIEGLFSGRMRIHADDIVTIGPDVIVVSNSCETRLETSNKGLNENIKSWLNAASDKATEKSQQFNTFWKKNLKVKSRDKDCPADISDSNNNNLEETPENRNTCHTSEEEHKAEQDKKEIF